MTHQLSNFSKSTRTSKTHKRVGRGIGSGVGKTSGRGQKGAGARSGYKRRYGTEGGQMPLFMKLPIRGFSNARFQKRMHAINLAQIEKIFQDGELVNVQTLRQRGFISGKCHGIKILGKGELTKKVTIQAHAFSESAREKLQQANIAFESFESAN